MIIYHQNNIAAFAGNHIWYWPLQPVVKLHVRIGVTPAVTGAGFLLQIPHHLRGGFNSTHGGFAE